MVESALQHSQNRDVIGRPDLPAPHGFKFRARFLPGLNPPPYHLAFAHRFYYEPLAALKGL
jgi:hypothetical protein